MLARIVTYSAWIALLFSSIGLVLTILKPTPQQPPKFVAGRTLGAIATILLAIGMLTRTYTWLGVILALTGCVLAIISLVFILRYRPES